jgi:hypothetical protein
MDCPNVANFKKPKLRPRYSRKNDYHACECGNCFFLLMYWSAVQEAKTLACQDCPSARIICLGPVMLVLGASLAMQFFKSLQKKVS